MRTTDRWLIVAGLVVLLVIVGLAVWLSPETIPVPWTREEQP